MPIMNKGCQKYSTNAQSTESYAVYSYFSLRADKSYTFLIGNHFMHGTYSLINPTELVLHSQKFGDIPLKILKENDGCIQITGDFKKYKSDFYVRIRWQHTILF